ncbi:Metallo-dependent phosphatase-like protein [Copromyces sp. CBS 386.78]|nr:Metallo-dependent phosphatase-like protein [Copromyces sp. CBS 386.78]
MIAEAMARFFRQRRCSATVGTSFILLAILSFFTIHLLGLNSAGQQSLFRRPATKASEKLPEMTSYQPSRLLTTQNNGNEHQLPIISDIELIDAIHNPITLISNLPKKHLPSTTIPSPPSAPSSDVSNNKRLVIIGDTHGRLTTLRSLLDKISFDNTTDHLILAGDLVTKGPDSSGLVQFARDTGASAVRGNHDDHVLEAAKWLSHTKQGKKWWGKTESEADSVSEDDEGVSAKNDGIHTVDTAGRRARNKKPKGVKPEHIAVARSLSASQLHWLASQPIILRVGHLFGAKTAPWNAKEIVVVHGGLIPSLPLEKQDPWAVMNMRSLAYELSSASTSDNISKDDGSINTTTHKRVTTIPLDTREGEPWSRAWNRYQNLISNASKRVAVVYGHDARSGLQVNKDITINLGKSPIPISARQIAGTGDQTVNVTSRGDVEIEIETEVAIESESEVEINVYSGGTVTTTTTTTASTGMATQTVTTGGSGEEEDDDDDDDPTTSTLSTTTTTIVTKAPTTAAKTGTVGKGSPKNGGNEVEAKRSRKKPKKKFKGTRYAYGLDSGCGHGKQLSALVLEVNQAGDDIIHRLEQVECE